LGCHHRTPEVDGRISKNAANFVTQGFEATEATLAFGFDVAATGNENHTGLL
jgi:hypothetical protein